MKRHFPIAQSGYVHHLTAALKSDFPSIDDEDSKFEDSEQTNATATGTDAEESLTSGGELCLTLEIESDSHHDAHVRGIHPILRSILAHIRPLRFPSCMPSHVEAFPLFSHTEWPSLPSHLAPSGIRHSVPVPPLTPRGADNELSQRQWTPHNSLRVVSAARESSCTTLPASLSTALLATNVAIPHISTPTTLTCDHSRSCSLTR